ncbi:MAG: DEAD/DEAH box helicase [Clostridium sp.]
MSKSFSELGLKENIINGLLKQGITTPTEIQEMVIEDAILNKDLIGEAHTGSGKTLAFVCPLFQKINSEKREMQALILAPTHELVMQIEAQIKLLSENAEMNVTSLTIIGDVNIDKQIKKLKDIKPHIIVGTPGRVVDLIRKKKITAHTLKTIVIDEGDNLLDNTSSKTVQEIIKTTLRDRQIMVFSATVSKGTLEVAKGIMKDPVINKVEKSYALNPNIEHMYITVDQRDKFETLRKILAATNMEKTMVFVNNPYEIENVAEKLNYHNKATFGVHKRLTKEQRQIALEKFRNGKINVLVTSDVSARGLDIPGIKYIINLDSPMNFNEYLHRAGRTARGNESGTTITLVTAKDLNNIRTYERKFKIKINERVLKQGELV